MLIELYKAVFQTDFNPGKFYLLYVHITKMKYQPKIQSVIRVNYNLKSIIIFKTVNICSVRLQNLLNKNKNI